MHTAKIIIVCTLYSMHIYFMHDILKIFLLKMQTKHLYFQGVMWLEYFYIYIYIYICNPPRVHTATTRRSGSRTRDFGAGGGRSNKERQRLQPLASVARAPLFEVRRVRFTHSPYWHSYIRYIYIYIYIYINIYIYKINYTLHTVCILQT